MTSTTMSKPSRVGRLLRAPIRALASLRDFYMRSITSCAGQMNQGAGFGYGPYALPHSFSTTSSRASASDEDLRDLIRVASQKHARGTGTLNGLPPRSRSVAVGRIDEDSPFDLSGTNSLDVGSNLLFPRSQSCATGKIGGKGFPRSIV